MFDQKDVEAYRKIKVPGGLREQVIRLEQKPEPTRARTKRISFGSPTAATCAAILLIAALPSFAVHGETALLYQGIPTGVEPVSIPADYPQMTSELREVSGGIPLALGTGETAQVSVSGDEPSLFDPGDEPLGDDTEAEISGDVLLYWDLSGTEGTMFFLTLKTNGKQFTYVLSMRDDGGYNFQQSQSPE